MTDVMTKTDRLRQGLVETQSHSHRPSDLGDLQRVSQAGYEVVALGVDEHLGLVLQPTEGLGVDDAVAIPFEGGPVFVGFFGDFSAPAVGGSGGGRGQKLVLESLPLRPVSPENRSATAVLTRTAGGSSS